ncbi:MAG: ATP-grasp domain-containing protein [Treponema sp.]|nr:ATP-grasp domain-containing protein [Treponema sp.]
MTDTKQRQILILGAGLMQKPSILAAKELGYKAVVVDANPHALCVPLADRFETIDLKDRPALAAFAKSLMKEEGGLVAVFTAGTDFSASVSYVAEQCGLKAHAFEAALNASDKLRMRACFSAYGVPSPDFSEMQKADIAFLGADETCDTQPGVLKVVKPCDNMGGRGCRLVRSRQEWVPALTNAVSSSRTGRAIVEDYMAGPEFSIDSVVYNGTLTITGFADRHIYFPPYFIETGHTMPTCIDEKMRLELIAAFALGIKALGLSCGVAKADIKYTENGPMIGEIAARLSGGYMSGWTYPYASDVPLTKTALQVALGEEPSELVKNRVPLPWAPHPAQAGKEQPFLLYELPCKRTSAERAWISIPGVVSRIYGLKEASGVLGVRDVLPRVHEGDEVRFPRNNVEKCGNIIAVGSTRADAVDSAQLAVSGITLRLTPHNAGTDAFLGGLCAEDESGFPPQAFSEAFSLYSTHCSDAEKGKTIPACVPVAPLLPPALSSLTESTDWNHLSLKNALARFDELCPNHPELDANQFWLVFLRGSVQGALYLADSASSGAVSEED